MAKDKPDSKLRPLPGAEPYRYHDRILYSTLDQPSTLRHATRPGLRMKRASGRARTGRKTTRT